MSNTLKVLTGLYVVCAATMVAGLAIMTFPGSKQPVCTTFPIVVQGSSTTPDLVNLENTGTVYIGGSARYVVIDVTDSMIDLSGSDNYIKFSSTQQTYSADDLAAALAKRATSAHK